MRWRFHFCHAPNTGNSQRPQRRFPGSRVALSLTRATLQHAEAGDGLALPLGDPGNGWIGACRRAKIVFGLALGGEPKDMGGRGATPSPPEYGHWPGPTAHNQ